MNHVAALIERFGGTRPMAAKLNAAGFEIHWNTVQNWKRVGRIPPDRVPAVREAAKANQIKITAAELVTAVMGCAA